MLLLQKLVAKEIEVLKRCKHKHVNELLEDFKEIQNGEEIVCLVLEYCEETFTKHMAKYPNKRLPESKALYFMKQFGK